MGVGERALGCRQRAWHTHPGHPHLQSCTPPSPPPHDRPRHAVPCAGGRHMQWLASNQAPAGRAIPFAAKRLVWCMLLQPPPPPDPVQNMCDDDDWAHHCLLLGPSSSSTQDLNISFVTPAPILHSRLTAPVSSVTSSSRLISCRGGEQGGDRAGGRGRGGWEWDGRT